MKHLKSRVAELLIPEKVAEEVSRPRTPTPLKRFLENHPEVIAKFATEEESLYIRVLAQPGIDEGEAAAIAIALNRQLPLVVEDKRGTAKAK